MKKYLIILTVAVLLNACNNPSSDKKEEHADHGVHAHKEAGHADHQDPRTKELMAIHDSIMPRMGTVMDLKQQLKLHVKTLDSLYLIKSDPVLKSQKARALALANQLESADQSMMGWMHQYKADTLQKLGEKQAADYIAAQKVKIVSVRDQTLAGIAGAEDFLRKNKKP